MLREVKEKSKEEPLSARANSDLSLLRLRNLTDSTSGAMPRRVLHKVAVK
jgi:hypothetical protein